MIRGAQRDIPVVKKTIQASIHNRFDIEVIDSRTGRIKSKAFAENVICDNLYKNFTVTTGYFSYIHYGSGTGTPSPSDVSLFNKVGHGDVRDDSTIVELGSGEKDGVAYLRKKITLSETTAAGVTLTEVGIAAGTGNGTLCTHAMLRDMNGNPVSLEKTAVDIVHIYATVYVHYSLTGYSNGSIRIHPVLYNNDRGFLMFLAGRYNSSSGNGGYRPMSYCASVGGYQPAATNGSAPASGSVNFTIDASAKTITIRISRIPADQGNVGGLSFIQLMDYQVSSSGKTYGSGTSLVLTTGDGSWYPGSVIDSESVGSGDGTTTEFSLNFPNAHNARVYVDGVEQSDVEVLSIPKQSLFDQLMWISPYSTDGNLIPKFFTKGFGATSVSFNPDTYDQLCFYNPGYEIGIKSLSCKNMLFEMSNDFSTWVTIGSGGTSSTALTIPEEYRHYKYGRFVAVPGKSITFGSFEYPSDFTWKAVKFNTPPAAGSVITARYETPVIAKDENHVFDLTVTIQLGEYTEAQ